MILTPKNIHENPALDEEIRFIYEQINLVRPSIGTIKPWFFPNGVSASRETDVPAGWLLCSGKLVSTVAYPDLFALLGYRYGLPTGNRQLFALPTLTALDTNFGWIIRGI